MNHTVFITGAAGYVGAMLVRRFAARSDVGRIIGLDKEACPDLLLGIDKLVWVHINTSGDWEKQVSSYAPDIVIHAAWQIREMYGKQDEQWRWNITGSEKVFDFAFSTSSVKRLIHFSTVASYGAFPHNTIEHRFTENEPFRKTDYLYAEEKRIAEERLFTRYTEAQKRGSPVTVSIVRPAAITGPRGRYMRVRFGLQAALSGALKETFIHRLISAMVSFVPVTPTWCRQFIHEDDVVSIVELLAIGEHRGSPYEAFNICPPGDVVRGEDMARAVGKRPVRIHPWLIRIVFFIMWHISRGKVPTSRGGWKSYSYPIAVDGSKLTRMYGFAYTFTSKDAFVKKEGEYMQFVTR